MDLDLVIISPSLVPLLKKKTYKHLHMSLHIMHHGQCKEEEDLNHEFQMLHTQLWNIKKNMFIHTHIQFCSIFFLPLLLCTIYLVPSKFFVTIFLTPTSSQNFQPHTTNHKKKITTVLLASLKEFARYRAIIVNIFHECENKNSKSNNHQ